MKKTFFIATLITFFSCTNDYEHLDTSLSSSLNSNNVTYEMLQKGTTSTISYQNAKILAHKYSDSLNIILDKIEDNNFKDIKEAELFGINYSNNSLNEINSSIINQLGYEGSFEFSMNQDSYIINIEDIEKLDLSNREVFYLSKLYESYLNKEDAQLISITDSYLNELKSNNELESLSMCFALIDVNRDLFGKTFELKADANCARSAMKDAVYGGCVGMIRGAIRGGLTGIVIGGGNPITGGAGAIVGAVSQGLIGFIGGGIQSYVRCKVGV